MFYKAIYSLFFAVIILWGAPATFNYYRLPPLDTLTTTTATITGLYCDPGQGGRLQAQFTIAYLDVVKSDTDQFLFECETLEAALTSGNQFKAKVYSNDIVELGSNERLVFSYQTYTEHQKVLFFFFLKIIGSFACLVVVVRAIELSRRKRKQLLED